MKKPQSNLFTLLSFLVLQCERFENNDSTNGDYPTTIQPLSAAKLTELTSEFNALNDKRVCTPLNEFGFIKYKLTYCLTRKIQRIEIKDEASKIRLAKETLLKNTKFSGITDTSALVVKRSTPLRGCIKCDGSDGDTVPIAWRIEFENQVYKNIEVKETRIVAFLDTNGVYMMGGNWYPDIFIPDKDIFSVEASKKNLIGTEITWYGWGGKNVFVVESDSFSSNVRKVIIPFKNNNAIELRLTWKFYVGGSSWAIYVDTTTGETVGIYQLFET